MSLFYCFLFFRNQKQIKIGNEFKFLTNPKDPHLPNQWIAFVRPVSGEDLSQVIKKVTFYLHETFPNPQRGIEIIMNHKSS